MTARVHGGRRTAPSRRRDQSRTRRDSTRPRTSLPPRSLHVAPCRCDHTDVRLAPLPVDGSLADIRAALISHRAAVIVAPPGTGKTTRVPPAVADAGRVVVLQPRRVRRAVGGPPHRRRTGWTLGREVGWHVRFDRRFIGRHARAPRHRGHAHPLPRRGPAAHGTCPPSILDEFHERSLHTDLGLALVAEAWRARGAISA